MPYCDPFVYRGIIYLNSKLKNKANNSSLVYFGMLKGGLNCIVIVNPDTIIVPGPIETGKTYRVSGTMRIKSEKMNTGIQVLAEIIEGKEISIGEIATILEEEHK